MKEILNIKDKKVSIFYDELKELPLVFLNGEDGEQIWKACKDAKCNDFILITIENIDWNKDLTPWYMKSLFKNDDEYSGKADEYLDFLTKEIVNSVIDKIKIKPTYMCLAGYSLAGLFTLYAMYKTDIFSCFISCSGSFWYPDFLEYVKNNECQSKPSRVYLSLGNKEKNSRNVLLSTVEDKTVSLYDYLISKDINCILEMNDGGHFKDADKRIAKGIKWIL